MFRDKRMEASLSWSSLPRRRAVRPALEVIILTVYDAVDRVWSLDVKVFGGAETVN